MSESIRTGSTKLGGVVKLFDTLRGALPGFDAINMTESGEHTRFLRVLLGDPKEQIRLGFDQISDGQRAWAMTWRAYRRKSAARHPGGP